MTNSKRNNEELSIDITPIKQKKYLLGVKLKPADKNFAVNMIDEDILRYLL